MQDIKQSRNKKSLIQGWLTLWVLGVINSSTLLLGGQFMPSGNPVRSWLSVIGEQNARDNSKGQFSRSRHPENH